MRWQWQGIRSSKVVDEDEELQQQFKSTPGVKHKDVSLRVFDTTKKRMYSIKLDVFPLPRVTGTRLNDTVELKGNYIDAV